MQLPGRGHVIAAAGGHLYGSQGAVETEASLHPSLSSTNADRSILSARQVCDGGKGAAISAFDADQHDERSVAIGPLDRRPARDAAPGVAHALEAERQEGIALGDRG